MPRIDPAARQRLTARFGPDVAAWFDALPGLLRALAEQWQLELGAPIPRGSVSVVYRCRRADGRGAVLKVSPDRSRVAIEAAAVMGWHTGHSPAVLAVGAPRGALLIEAIEPGTPLVVSARYPALESVAALLGALHSGMPDSAYPLVEQRVAALFDASATLYDRHDELAARIPPELYARGGGSQPGSRRRPASGSCCTAT